MRTHRNLWVVIAFMAIGAFTQSSSSCSELPCPGVNSFYRPLPKGRSSSTPSSSRPYTSAPSSSVPSSTRTSTTPNTTPPSSTSAAHQVSSPSSSAAPSSSSPPASTRSSTVSRPPPAPTSIPTSPSSPSTTATQPGTQMTLTINSTPVTCSGVPIPSWVKVPAYACPASVLAGVNGVVDGVHGIVNGVVQSGVVDIESIVPSDINAIASFGSEVRRDGEKEKEDWIEGLIEGH